MLVFRRNPKLKSMPAPKGKTTITVYVDPEIRDKAAKLAKTKHLSVNGLINVMLETAIKQAEKKGELE